MATQTFRGITYTIRGLAANEPIGLGTALPDWIEAPLGNHLISTGAGDDVIFAGVDASGVVVAPNPGYLTSPQPIANAGNQLVYAGAGNDYVVTGTGNDVIDLGDGNDFLTDGFFSAPNGNSVVFGGGGNDLIYVYRALNAVIDGGSEDDVIQVNPSITSPGNNSATISGGSGNDSIDLGGRWETIFIDGGSGNDNLSAAVYPEFFSPDNSEIRSIPIVTATVLGGGGDDLVSFIAVRKNSNTFVDGGADNDYISVGSYEQINTATISIEGGSGNDYLNYSSGNSSTGITAQLDGGAGNDFLWSYYIPTDSGSFTFDGGAGDDIIFTLGESSTGPFVGGPEVSIYGGSGNDTIFAGQGNQTIYAGSGNDVVNLRGGTALYQQTLNLLNYGPIEFIEEYAVVGGGDDTVYLDSGADKVILGSTGLATIYGFGNNDFLDVTGLNATLTKSGGNTLIKSAGNTIGILKGYTGSVGLV
jgi:RTX calcium-binding nonapeptide repeat (4 copies)